MKQIIFICVILSTLLYSNIDLPTSFSSDFTQTVTTDKNKKIKYSGTLIFSSPNNFKWSYKTPTKKEVCTDGKELLIVDHDLEQVSAYIVDSGLNLASIIKKAKPHHEGVFVAQYKNKNYTIAINKRGELKTIAYRDDLDNIVYIIFSKMRYSSKRLNTSNLKCNYPSTYDHINN
jgi:outer membrane lipoprotein carrier protein